MSGIQITLAGVDVTANVNEMSLKVTDTLGQGAGVGGGSAGRASTCSFLSTLGPVGSAVGAGTHVTTPTLVRQGEIIVYDRNGVRIFGGFLGKIEDKTEKKQVYTQCECYDYYQALDRIQVQQIFSGATDVQIIATLLKKYAPWVDLSLFPTQGNYTFSVRNFKSITLQKVISQTTDVTGFQFWIDPYRRARYVTPLQSQTAPFSVSDAPDYQNTFPGKIESYITDDMAAINRVLFFGGKIPSNNFTQDLSTQANGNNRTFVLAYYPRVDQQGSIVVTSANLNLGKPLVLGYVMGTGTQNTFKSQGGLCDVLLNADAHTLNFDPGAAAPVNNGPNSVTATYRYEFPMTIVLTDQNSYRYYGSYYDGVISDSTIFDLPTAVGRCRTLLVEQSLGLTSFKVILWNRPGLQAGMILPVVNAVRQINNSYIIQEVDTLPLGAGIFRYEISVGAWNWNFVDILMNSVHASENANIPNTSYQDAGQANAVDVNQMLENVKIVNTWTKTTKPGGGPFYARSAPVGDGHDAYPGFCTAHA